MGSSSPFNIRKSTISEISKIPLVNNEDSTLSSRANIYFWDKGSALIRIDQVPLLELDFHETLKGRSAGEFLQIQRRDFDNYCQSKDMA